MKKIFVIMLMFTLSLSIIPTQATPLGFDKKIYTWTDKIHITIIAPDFNFDRYRIDEIGNDSFNPIKISTRGHTLNQYKLAETGLNTGIFTGEVILTGFCHNADGNLDTGMKSSSKCNVGDDTNPRTGPSQRGGPTNGFIESDNDDGITVSFEYTENYSVLGSAPIRWGIGQVQWLEANYPVTGMGMVRIIDPDMNLNPESIDNFDIKVWSDTDVGGINLKVTETNKATGVFEGLVYFTSTSESSGQRLRVTEGDTVTAKYEDNTLPKPYSTADDLDVKGTTTIGTRISSGEQITIGNTRLTDVSDNLLDEFVIDQSIQIVSDIQNAQLKNQPFTYIVQIKDSNDVIQHLAWISGSLTPAQQFSSGLSWIPQKSGNFEVTTFVWESMDNPISLAQPTLLFFSVK